MQRGHCQNHPRRDECHAADGRHRAPETLAGKRQDVEAAREYHDAHCQQAASPRLGAGGNQPYAGQRGNGQHSERVKEVIHHRALPDIHRISVQAALKKVRAERSEAYAQR
jgi:hypothetical protein